MSIQWGRGSFNLQHVNPADLESDIESELIDLHSISMTALRDLDSAVVERALRQVMQRTTHPGVSEASSDRID